MQTSRNPQGPGLGPKRSSPAVRYNALTNARIETWKVRKNNSSGEIKTGIAAKTPARRVTIEEKNEQQMEAKVGQNAAMARRPSKGIVKGQSQQIKSPREELKKDVVLIEKQQMKVTKPQKEVAMKGEKKTEEERPVSVSSAVQAFERGRKIENKVQPKKENEGNKEFVISPNYVLPKKKEGVTGQKYVEVERKQAKLKISVTPWKEGGVVETWMKGVERRSVGERKEEPLTAVSDERLETTAPAEAAATTETNEAKPEKKETTRPFSLAEDIETDRNSSVVDSKHPRAMDLVRRGERTLWRDLEVVQTSGKLEDLTKEERTRQEAKFELMMSEASYLNMLNLLRSHFMRHIEKHIPQVLTEEDYKTLFQNIPEIRTSSESFLKNLDEKWQEDVMLKDIYEVVTQYASGEARAYMKYCRNMLEMSNHLKELTTENEGFRELLEFLMNRQGAQKLTLDSFLTSPMQRITKLPLLMKTILDKTNPDSEEFRKCKTAYDAVCKIAHECDEVVSEKMRIEEMLRLDQQIEFPGDVATRPIVVAGRFVVAQADVKHFDFGEKNKRKMKLILFNDLLLVTKKTERRFSSGVHLTVLDHCPRDHLSMKEVQHNSEKSVNVAVLTLGCNSENKATDLVVTFSDADQWRAWRSHFATPTLIPEAEDTVQVIVLQEHVSAAPGELELERGDVIQVTGEETDGWCQGERMSDGSTGRFLMSKTTRINSHKMRMVNMKTKMEMRNSRMSNGSGN